jgi:transposase
MSSGLDNFDLNALPADLREAVLAVDTARIKAEERADQLQIYTKRLAHLVMEFKKARFGRKSEKLNPDQLNLIFEELETALAETETAQETAETQSGAAATRPKQNAKRNLGHLPKELPRIENTIYPDGSVYPEPDNLQCPCGCGKPMVKIGEDRTERLHITPASFRVIVTIRPKYAPPKSCDGKVMQAPAPAHLIEGALPSEALIAHVLVSKYADHLPLYRQSQIFARSGVELHRSTLAGWAGKAAFHLRPIVDRMAEQIKTSTKLFMDETPAPVLDPGRGKTKTGYLWALARDDRGWGGNDPPCIIFNYAPGRSGKYAEEFLQDFNGILQVDAYGGYNRLTVTDRTGGEPIVLAYCWAHARRKLFDLIETSDIAMEGVRRVAELYAIEDDIRGQSPANRLAARQARSAPLAEAFGVWLEQQRARVSSKSRLGEKLSYIARYWDGLQIFLTDGRVEMDSNPVENAIRPIALSRKNALFAGHDEGGKNWGLFASLIGTCKLNDVNPFDYLKTTFEALANGHPQSRLDDLMPWAF